MADHFPAEFQAVRPTLDMVAEQTRALRIVNGEQYESASSLLQTVKGALKQIEEQRTSITKPLNDALRNANAQAKVAAAPFEDAERTIKRALVAYTDEQERLRRDAQRKADEAARKERERIDAQAREVERKAREKAEADRRAADEAAAAGRAEEAARLAERAATTEAKAAEKVEALEVRAATVVAPIIQREPPKVAGISTREVWKFRISNAAAVPREYCAIDEARIRKVVAALKGDTAIPGVEVYAERVMAAGAA